MGKRVGNGRCDGPPIGLRRAGERGDGSRGSTTARLLWWSTVKAALAVAHRLEIHGRENLPGQPSFVLVANHASHLDALVLGSALPVRMRERLIPLAAGDVFFETPARAAFSSHLLNALPVWRQGCGAHAIQDLRQRLIEKPTIFILFPEGGRSRDGRMRPFKAGIGMLTAGTEVPVIPCHLQGTFSAFPPSARLPRPKKIALRIGRPRVFPGICHRRAGWNEIAALLENDVRRLGGLPPESSWRIEENRLRTLIEH